MNEPASFATSLSMDCQRGPRAYRPDIDGLRAIAVLAVIFFHGRVPGFGGGFVGVDVFFVISGYLITGIMLRERDAGTFRYFDFWERRLRRIAPALLVVAVAAALYTVIIRTPVEARLFGQSVSFLAIFASNHFFWQETGYFADTADRYLLLHTWSLAVEEQFYLIYPALLGTVYAWGDRTLPRALVLLALVSFAACAVIQPIDGRAAFFLSPFRFWELLIGALCAIWVARGATSAPLSGAVSEGLGFLGLTLIVASVLLLDSETAFPFWTALAPTIGSAAMIIAGTRGSVVSAIFSLKPLTAIGLISYSLYLWHWPVLVAAEDLLMRRLELAEALAALIGSAVMATLSYHFVEQPFRRRRSGGEPFVARLAVFTGAGAGALALIGFGIFLQETRGWPNRWPAAAVRMTSDEARLFGVDRDRCHDISAQLPESVRADRGEHFCLTGADGAPAETLFWGDSHANALWPAIFAAAREAGQTAILATKGACPPLIAAEDGSSGIRSLDKPACRRHGRAVLAAIDALKPRRITLMAHWRAYSTAPGEVDAIKERLDVTLKALAERGVEVRILINAPSYQRHVPTVLARAVILRAEPFIDASRAAHEARIAPFLSAIDTKIMQMLAEPPIRLDGPFCDERACRLVEDGLPYYRDSNHLNRRAALRLAPLLASSFGQ